MPSEKDIAWIASLVGDPARSRILLALMDGRARTAKELAFFARIAAPTASGHLAKLLDAHLVAVEPQGRHRYYRLASERVGQMIESMAIVAGDALPFPPPGRRIPEPLATARRCYDHLAGRTGVAIATRSCGAASSCSRTAAARSRRRATPSSPARARSRALRRDPARVLPPCLDWTERRHHLAGAVGAACASIAWSATGCAEPRLARALRSRRRASGALRPFRDRRDQLAPEPSGRRPEEAAYHLANTSTSRSRPSRP
jgi:DNA-binding transcriptional ArsR family regulator